VPDGFWGGDHNKRMIMKAVDQFVQLRKFESLTLHQVTQGLQVLIQIGRCVQISTLT
jgi:telomerase reverse transcriptase